MIDLEGRLTYAQVFEISILADERRCGFSLREDDQVPGKPRTLVDPVEGEKKLEAAIKGLSAEHQLDLLLLAWKGHAEENKQPIQSDEELTRSATLAIQRLGVLPMVSMAYLGKYIRHAALARGYEDVRKAQSAMLNAQQMTDDLCQKLKDLTHMTIWLDNTTDLLEGGAFAVVH